MLADSALLTRQLLTTASELRTEKDNVDDSFGFIEVSANVKTHLDRDQHQNKLASLLAGNNQNQYLKNAAEVSVASTLKPLIYPRMRGIHNVAFTANNNDSKPDDYWSSEAQMLKQNVQRGAGKWSSFSTNRSAASGALYSVANQPEAINLESDFVNKLYFDTGMPLDFKAHLGSTAYLLCRLRGQHQSQLNELNGLQVSWVRNMQILTSGEFRYTSDERFKPIHLQGTNDWKLEISQASAADEGSYECQVNSEPKPANLRMNLHIVLTTIEILEGALVKLDEGDDIRLTCRVEFASSFPKGQQPGDNEGRKNSLNKFDHLQSHYIYWYKNSNISLEYNNPRGNILVEKQTNSEDSFESVLTIKSAKREDNGLYSCKILPDLNDVLPAQAKVIVGADDDGDADSGASNESNSGSSSRSGLAFIGRGRTTEAKSMAPLIIMTCVSFMLSQPRRLWLVM